MRSKYAFYLLSFIIFFSPIPLGANRPWAWGLIEILICINTIQVCFTHSFCNVFERLKQVKVVLATLVAVQVWVFFQWLGGIEANLSPLFSLDPSQTEIALIKGITFCLFIINLSVLVTSEIRVKQVCWMIMAAGLFQAVYAIFLQYSGWKVSLLGFPIGERATGTFVYWNHLANYLLLCLSVAIGYLIGSLTGVQAISQRARLASFIEALLSPKWMMRITIIIMVVALIMTRSRMGNSAFFISLLATSVLALLIMKRPPNTLKWLIASLVILDLVIVGTYFGVDKLKERLQATSFEAETRDDVIRDSIPFIQDVWGSGTGAGSFYSTFMQYQSSEYKAFYDHAHNEYVQFLTEFGLFPSLLLFLMVIYVVCRAINTMHNKIGSLNRGLAMGAIMACIGMIMHTSVDFILQNYSIVLLFIVCIFLALVKTKNRSKKNYGD